ncbi:GyrI-like domain-containing protein [Enterococcus ureasiticus]|uniref:HTH araC/xylS-type domain-containing protein n=1 Tax=Enterococcus ureasiticus TaxID=903984 RepID=A0A1E5GMZ0_9ENTE|nr:helix-turn-helix domain-containing protein [Enterococcus ureasiticus]OEG14021.1 hypothetical protein BCR21_03245 [Enterococcus ureasiticus]
MKNLKAIDQAIEFIENNLYESITVADVAEAVSFSYYHFHRFFHLVMNETIGNYIRSRRLTQAAFDLNHSQKKILDISLSLGFETPESFTRAFKKRYSMTPSAYRRQGVDILIGNRPPVTLKSLDITSGLSPEVVYISPIKITGKRFSSGNMEDGYTSAWHSFKEEFLQDSSIKKRYGVFELSRLCEQATFNLDNSSSLFIGVECLDSPSLLESYQTKQIKGGKYAKFTHKGLVIDILLSYQYIWGVWLVESQYELDERNDFELYTDHFKGENNNESEIYIYIPIK